MKVVLYFIFVVTFTTTLLLFVDYQKRDCKSKVITNCHDTLVELETIKYLPRTDLNKDYTSTTIEESQPDVLFKDGKTRDTIIKTITEYY